MKTIFVKKIARDYCLFEGQHALIGTIKKGVHDPEQKKYLKQYYYIEDYNGKVIINSRFSYPKYNFEFSIDPEIKNENYTRKVVFKLNKKNLLLGIVAAIILAIITFMSYIIFSINFLQNEQKVWSLIFIPLPLIVPIFTFYIFLKINLRILLNENEIYDIIKKFRTPYKVFRLSDYKEVAKIEASGIFSYKNIIEIYDDIDYLYILSAFLYLFSRNHLNGYVYIPPAF